MGSARPASGYASSRQLTYVTVDPADPGTPATVPLSHLWPELTTVALGTTASVLSGTVVGIGIPAIQRQFGGSLTELQWIITGYLLALAAVVPVSGYLCDRFGSRTVYVTTLVVFTVASAVCGLAWSPESEVAFRVVQGAAGGMVIPVGTSIVVRRCAVDQRGRVMSVLGVPSSVVPVLGPTIGGLLIARLGWQWLFWMNLPPAAVAIALALRYVRDNERTAGLQLDLVGLLLVTPSVLLVLLGVTYAPDVGWADPRTLGPITAGVILAALFIRRSLKRGSSLLDLSIFRDRSFAASVFLMVVIASCTFGAVFLIPLFLQGVQGYSPFQAGLLMAAQGLAATLALPFVGYLSDRVGPRPVAIVAVLMLAASIWLMTPLGPATPALVWVVVLALRGLGLAFGQVPVRVAAYANLPRHLISRATASQQTLQRMGMSVGTAVFATVVQVRVAERVAADHSHAATVVARGFGDAFWLAGALALVGLPAAMLLGAAADRRGRGWRGRLSLVVRERGAAGAAVAAASGIALAITRAFS